LPLPQLAILRQAGAAPGEVALTIPLVLAATFFIMSLMGIYPRLTHWRSVSPAMGSSTPAEKEAGQALLAAA
jgi:hypothetical protein